MSNARPPFHLRAAEVIDGVLRRYVADGSLESVEADDVRSVVMLNLARRFGDDAAPDDIRSIDDFVATMVHNAARDVFRSRSPDRARLRKRLRAIVREDARFVVLDESPVRCTLREHAAAPRVETIQLLDADFAAARSMPLDDLLELLLKRAEGPVCFEQLFELATEVTGVERAGKTIAIDETEPAGRDAPIELQLIARETLTALWNEICELPLPQRTALLLHLRDDRGASAIPLLVFTGTATLDEIGAVLQLDRSRMERMWDELPLADLDIARLLETTAQRVVGLRRAARERLGRFLRRFGREHA